MDQQVRAARIVAALQEDMLCRRGFRQNWDRIDDDIRVEILAAWVLIVTKELEATE